MSESAPAIEGAAEVSADEKLSAELAEWKDRHLRLQAEFENFRKRKNKEAEEIRRYAFVPVMELIIPVLDHFDLALDGAHDRTDPKWGEGIEHIARQLGDTLKSLGLQEIMAEKGAALAPTMHDAIARLPADDVEEGRIVATVRKGYRIGERIVRPAQVTVAAPPTAAEN